MISRLVHDSSFGASIAHNALLIVLIVTKTPKSYAVVLFYLPFVEISMAISSLLIYRRELCTSDYSIHAIGGICRHWGSPFLCFCWDAIQLAGTAHYAVMIAFCSCYRYYVVAFTRGEPKKKCVLLALICAHLPTIAIYANFARAPLLTGFELKRAMNESHPEYSMDEHRNDEILLVARRTFGTWLAANWIQGIIFPVCIVVLLASIGITRILASVEHMSTKSKRRHSMILRGLICQAAMPAFYAVVVVIYRAEREMMHNSNDIGHFKSVLASVILAVSPFFTIFFTIPYREALVRMVSSSSTSSSPILIATEYAPAVPL